MLYCCDIIERYFEILTAHWQKPHIPQNMDSVLCSAVQILKHSAVITGLDSVCVLKP